MIESEQSFTVETTLSGATYLKMAIRAKEAGFNVAVFFVGTASIEINIARVKARVLKGGHDVPEEGQRRRYPRTLANMKKLLPVADLAVLYDNSTSQGHILVGAGHSTFTHWVEPQHGPLSSAPKRIQPAWDKQDAAMHLASTTTSPTPIYRLDGFLGARKTNSKT